MRIESPPDCGIPGIGLRQIERSDRQAWFDYLRLPEVYERTSWNVQLSGDLDSLFDGFESIAPTSPRRLAVVDLASGRLAGTIGFHTVSDINRTAEIAYDLAPSHWGRGVASRLCDLVTRWSFDTYGFVRVQGTVLIGNDRSDRVLLRSGYQHEGLLRSFRMVRGRPGDFNMYSRLSTTSEV
ncbi:MAG: N-acetyltransferase [Rubrivivax sp.]|nr:MAG: N-acetyltransferase [Rubrivivax sp.]